MVLEQPLLAGELPAFLGGGTRELSAGRASWAKEPACSGPWAEVSVTAWGTQGTPQASSCPGEVGVGSHFTNQGVFSVAYPDTGAEPTEREKNKHKTDSKEMLAQVQSLWTGWDGKKHRCRRWCRRRVCKCRLVPACFSKCDGIGSPPAFLLWPGAVRALGGVCPRLWNQASQALLSGDSLFSDRGSKPLMGDSPEPKPRCQQLPLPGPFSNVSRAPSSDFLTPKGKPREQAAIKYPEKVAGTGHVTLYPLICQEEKRGLLQSHGSVQVQAI